MKEKYSQVKEKYDQYYKFLLQDGQFLFKDTKDGSWGVSITEEVFELFDKLNLSQYNSFLDLGSGDGKVVLLASLFCKAVGIESDDELYEISHKMKKKLQIHNATFLHRNYFNHDFSQYDVIYILPDKPFRRGLQAKLQEELKGILIVYGNHFLPNLKVKEQIILTGTTITIYEQHP